MAYIARRRIETRTGVRLDDKTGAVIAEGEFVGVDAGQPLDPKVFSPEQLASLHERGVVYDSADVVVEEKPPPVLGEDGKPAKPQAKAKRA